MRYDNLRAFEKHLEGAAPKLLSSLYCIVGKDPFACAEANNLLLSYLLPSEEMRQFGLSSFEGSHLEESEIETTLYTYSFFTKCSVIWISQADKLKKNIQDILVKYFTRSQPSVYLLLSASALQKNTSFYKAIEKEGVVLEFAELKPWEREKYLVDWVTKQLTANRKLISFQACQFLVKQSGNEQGFLSQEIAKLLCYSGEKKEITLEDVKAICLHQHTESVWQLGEAIFLRNKSEAFQIADSLLMDGQALLPLLRQIRSQFQTEYQIGLLLACGKQAQGVMQQFPYMKGQILERHMRQAQQYGLDAFKRGFIALDAAEMRLKNFAINEKIVMELLLFQLTK